MSTSAPKEGGRDDFDGLSAHRDPSTIPGNLQATPEQAEQIRGLLSPLYEKYYVVDYENQQLPSMRDETMQFMDNSDLHTWVEKLNRILKGIGGKPVKVELLRFTEKFDGQVSQRKGLGIDLCPRRL